MSNESEKKFVREMQTSAQEGTYKTYVAGYTDIASELERLAVINEQYADLFAETGDISPEQFRQAIDTGTSTYDAKEKADEIYQLAMSAIEHMRREGVITKQGFELRSSGLDTLKEDMRESYERGMEALERIREAYDKRSSDGA